MLGRVFAGAICLYLAAGCDDAYPEVVIVNQTADEVQLRDISFSGCAWGVVLARGEATAPARCLPGADRVHFAMLDAAGYCREQAEDRSLAGICPCGGNAGSDGGSSGESDPGLVNTTPTWFNYQTVSVHRVEYGEFHVFAVSLDDIEQDFSVPGPYGH